MDTTSAPTVERQLGGALEPVIGQVYFSPECHANYVALGFDPSPGDANGVALPDGVAYFTSRGSVMGQVRGNVVASAFAVFNPAAVIPAVDAGWKRTTATDICDARDRGALDQLTRCIGADAPGAERVEELLVRATDGLDCVGRPLAAGIQNLDDPDHPYGTIFRRGDLLREYRGDSHTIAWVGAGLSAVELGLLTELYWGLPLRSYSRTRAWSEEQFDAAQQSLEDRGFITPDGTFTDEGRSFREQIEARTDEHMAPVIDALGDDVEELITVLSDWGRQVRAGHGYLASGPHDLAARGSAL
jgi:hypothetical protein